MIVSNMCVSMSSRIGINSSTRTRSNKTLHGYTRWRIDSKRVHMLRNVSNSMRSSSAMSNNTRMYTNIGNLTNSTGGLGRHWAACMNHPGSHASHTLRIPFTATGPHPLR